MKTQIEDKKLRAFLKSTRLESPGVDFSAHVMNRIFEEKAVLEQVKNEPVLKKGFWIIIALFTGLFVAVALSSGNGAGSGGALGLLNQVNTDAVATGYQSFFEKLGAVPLSIAGIFLASSLLLFIEKLLNRRSGIFSN